MHESQWFALLNLGNLTFSSANAILSFALALYLLAQNGRSEVARAFCALLVCMITVHIGDVMLLRIDNVAAAYLWLKFQWLGLAFFPAAFMHFSVNLLRTTNDDRSWRRSAVFLFYLLGAVFLWLALATNLVVGGEPLYFPYAAQFAGGEFFALYALYFFVLTGWGWWYITRARARSLTPTSRRRTTYLSIAVVAPTMGVFPYLLLASQPSNFPIWALLVITLVGNVAIAFMIIITAYTVAYYGAMLPDRIIKRSLVKFLVQGPILGIAILGLLYLVPAAERALRIPHDMALLFAVVGAVVGFQILIILGEPLVDLIVFWSDRTEIIWLRRLDERLLTHSDLRQLLENLLVALCDRLRSNTAFVATVRDGELRLDAQFGNQARALACLDSLDAAHLLDLPRGRAGIERWDGFWVMPLRGADEEGVLGMLAVATHESDLTPEECTYMAHLGERAGTALADRRLQQGLIGALRQIGPEIESLQRLRVNIRYPGAPPLDTAADTPISDPDLVNWVKDALNHYWGGPKLTESPLLRLRIVRDALEQNDYNAARAVRAVLTTAMEHLKPEGERSLTANEWLLYNILDLRFIQGLRVRDIAPRLAMSESDLYRKQRIALDEVAKTLTAMENEQINR